MDHNVETTNVVGTIVLRQELDLQELSHTFETHSSVSSVTYEPAENHWLQTHIGEEDVYVAFYRSGTVSIVGCSALEEFHRMADSVDNILRDILDYEYTPGREISNIVSTASLCLPVPLDRLAIALGLENVEYEPEQFPALLYRVQGATVLIFDSGKVVVTGLRDPDKAVEIVEHTREEIQSISTQS